jgi:hypothetical protein
LIKESIDFSEHASVRGTQIGKGGGDSNTSGCLNKASHGEGNVKIICPKVDIYLYIVLASTEEEGEKVVVVHGRASSQPNATLVHYTIPA